MENDFGLKINNEKAIETYLDNKKTNFAKILIK